MYRALTFFIFLGLSTFAHADTQICDAGSLSCLHDPVGKQCGLGTCLPDGRTMGGGFSCDCVPGTGNSGDTKCSHGSLDCLHKDVGDRCGFAGACMTDGASPMGMTCECKGGEVPVGPGGNDGNDNSGEEPTSGWHFCSQGKGDEDICAGTKNTFCYVRNVSNLISLSCSNGQLAPAVATPGNASKLAGLQEIFKVDGAEAQTMAVAEAEEKGPLGKLVWYTASDVLAADAIDKLKSGGKVTVQILTAEGKVLHSISYTLHHSRASIESLQGACK